VVKRTRAVAVRGVASRELDRIISVDLVVVKIQYFVVRAVRRDWR
jgi:hypothetical protein